MNGETWWPGQIQTDSKTNRRKLYRVDFFGYPPSQAYLPLSKIIKYENNDRALHPGRISPELKRAIT